MMNKNLSSENSGGKGRERILDFRLKIGDFLALFPAFQQIYNKPGFSALIWLPLRLRLRSAASAERGAPFRVLIADHHPNPGIRSFQITSQP
jgi:hypothetical protein